MKHFLGSGEGAWRPAINPIEVRFKLRDLRDAA